MSTSQLTTDLPDNLPVLTEKVGLEWEDELPLLTDVVVLARAENAVAQNEDVELPEEISAEPSLPVEVFASEDDLPLLQETMSDAASIIATEPLVVTQSVLPTEARELNAEEIQQVVLQLQAQLESVFVQKLTAQLAQAQQQAITNAVNEFKADLPEMLRAALHAASHR